MNKVTIKIDDAYCYKYWLFKHLISKRYKRQNTLYVEDIDDIYNYIENKVIIDGKYPHRAELQWFKYYYEIAYYKIRYIVLNYNYNSSFLNDNELNISLKSKIIDIYQDIEKDKLLIPWHNTEPAIAGEHYISIFENSDYGRIGITYFSELLNKAPNFHIISLDNNKNLFEIPLFDNKIFYINYKIFYSKASISQLNLISDIVKVLNTKLGNIGETLYHNICYNIISEIEDKSDEYYNYDYKQFARKELIF